MSNKPGPITEEVGCGCMIFAFFAGLVLLWCSQSTRLQRVPEALATVTTHASEHTAGRRSRILPPNSGIYLPKITLTQ